jgi:hypothetical protein
MTRSAWSLRTRAANRRAMLAPSTTARFIVTEAEIGASDVLTSANTFTGEVVRHQEWAEFR